ncbi:MAG: hypothetical protein A2268_00230 [Candidatus Raymondbacteria bacterium RifOxyA12_full_50_37]|nr:MAG: hypothetical protein A2268_00230 [Candidatus Raymondbacteria bacterium RifOxyA12_full_50_37]OGJ92745.1 MAG: hypothetical protein A2248_04280 [Candidatus Raymondbacteria bacterium RIFOXYA2_FULL_49_16]OGK04176.1 MAG: hypothetical protein A2350_02625 [Candidatus Raymondbacteria bacterium RifOxyB12_full_50_8]OGP44521.1 MAG: hypothetical protein A2324_10075 [Candidatus Raymondbacteria bacterium RIFOXYB2_FULL_49_35]
MITFDEAYKKMMAAARPLPVETVPLEDAAGRILAGDVFSDVDMPPFDKAAMDGYACRRADLARGELEVIETIPAGVFPEKTVLPGTCARILTGAPLPQGADCVVMQEQVERDGMRIRIRDAQTPDNLCRRGEDVLSGDRVFTQGERITPAHAAMLASVGAVRPRVFMRPRVAILATGNELVEPSQRPGPAQIRNSNGWQLAAQVRAMGALLSGQGVVADTEADIDAALRQAMARSDVILLSGGVSTGDFDLVPEALKKLDFSFLFDSVAMQPGRPTVFAVKDLVYCCGLPGNPVSTYVIFEILVKPFLFRLMGHSYRPLVVEGRLTMPVRRKNMKRQAAVPVRFVSPGDVEPVPYHGSAHIRAMAGIDGIVFVPVGSLGFEKGERVHVRSFSA